MIKRNVFFKAAITGLLLIAVSISMMIVGKVTTTGIWMPEGFKVPILALEFASSNDEIQRIVNSISEPTLEHIIAATQIDMLFMIIYNLFLLFVLRSIYTVTKLVQYKWLAFLPYIIMLADLVENVQLFNAFNHAQVVLIILQLATWIKWFGLAIAFTAIGRFLITTGRYYDKVLALSTYVTIPLGIWALLSHSAINEVFGMLFYLLFPMIIIYTWFPGITKKV